MANLDVTISGSAPNFGVNPSGGTYPAPLTVMFTNTSTTDDCKLWYQLQGQLGVQNTLLTKNGGTFPFSGGVSFAVSATNVNIQPALSHVIHVGSGAQ